MNEKDRQRLREKIDELDDLVAKALSERAQCAIDIGHIKKRSGEKLFDPQREQQIFERLTTNNSGPLTSDAIIRIFERIIDESRRVERIKAYEGQ
jgi:chorismate mutase